MLSLAETGPEGADVASGAGTGVAVDVPAAEGVEVAETGVDVELPPQATNTIVSRIVKPAIDGRLCQLALINAFMMYPSPICGFSGNQPRFQNCAILPGNGTLAKVSLLSIFLSSGMVAGVELSEGSVWLVECSIELMSDLLTKGLSVYPSKEYFSSLGSFRPTLTALLALEVCFRYSAHRPANQHITKVVSKQGVESAPQGIYEQQKPYYT